MTLQRGPDPEPFRVQHYGARWYRDPLPTCTIAAATGDIWPSVTTVKKAWSKPFRRKLPDGSGAVPLDAYWAAEFVLDNLQAVVALAGDRDAAMSLICSAPRRSLSHAAGRGTAVHEVIEHLAAGHRLSPVDVPDAARPWLPACEAFVAEWQPRFLLAEVIAFNRSLGYAGTFDALVEIDGHRWLVDWKSRGSEHGCYEDEVAQLGGYSSAEYVVLADPAGRPYRAPMPQVDGALVVSLTPDGAEATTIDLEGAREAWRHMHTSWRGHREGQRAAREARGPILVRAAAASAGPVSPTGPADPPATAERMAWLRDRIATIYGAGAGPDLEALWHVDDVPIPSAGGHTDAQVDIAAGWCLEVERAHGLPFPLPDPADEQPAPAEPEPAPVEPVDQPPAEQVDDDRAEAEALVARGRELLDGFDDPGEVAAIVACAGMTGYEPMTAELLARLEAVVDQIARDNGAVRLVYGPDGPAIEPTATAVERMEHACAESGNLRRSHALARAKRIARALGLPVPRGLARAAENPTLAALVAAGFGTTPESEDT